MKAWRQHRCGSAIRIEQALHQDLPNSSGSLAIFTAITEGTSLLMCPYGYFRASIIRFAIACCSSGGRSLIASVNLSGSPSAHAYHDEGGAKLRDEKSRSNPND